MYACTKTHTHTYRQIEREEGGEREKARGRERTETHSCWGGQTGGEKRRSGLAERRASRSLSTNSTVTLEAFGERVGSEGKHGAIAMRSVAPACCKAALFSACRVRYSR